MHRNKLKKKQGTFTMSHLFSKRNSRSRPVKIVKAKQNLHSTRLHVRVKSSARLKFHANWPFTKAFAKNAGEGIEKHLPFEVHLGTMPIDPSIKELDTLGSTRRPNALIDILSRSVEFCKLA